MIIQFYETIWWNSEYLFGHELFSIFTACCYFIENSKTPSHSNQWKQWSLKNAGLTCINVVAKKLKNIPLRRLIVWGGGCEVQIRSKYVFIPWSSYYPSVIRRVVIEQGPPRTRANGFNSWYGNKWTI